MDFNGTPHSFVFIPGCILFAAHAVKVARDILTADWGRRAFETCGKLAQLLRSRFWRRAVVDEFEEEVACRLLDWQLSQFRSALKVLLLVSAMPCMAVAFCKETLGLDRWMTLAQEILMVAWYAALLLADWCPWLVTKPNLNLWYSGLMAIPALSIIPPLGASDHFLTVVGIVRLVGAVLSVARMNLSAVVLWSGVHMACEYWAHATQFSRMEEYLRFFWPCMLIMLIGRFEAHVEAELRTSLEAKVMQDRHSASDALSAMFYDVVVELDHDRCIVEPTPRLAAFLLRSTPAPLERTPLEDLLPDEEDRVRLRNLLCPAEGPAASSFVELAHARMRGGMGTIFQAELFGYRFRGPGGRQRYLVGIRDAGDLGRGGVPMGPAGPLPVAMAPLDEVAVVIDPDDYNFRILSHTCGFSNRIMPVAEGTCLLPAGVKEAAFAAWVQEAVNWHIADFSEDEEKPGEPPPESLEVTLRPHGRNSPMRTSAVCKLKVEERVPSDRESRGGQFAVELKFSDVVQGTRGVKRTSGNDDSGSSSSSRSCRGTPSFSPRMPLEGHFAL